MISSVLIFFKFIRNKYLYILLSIILLAFSFLILKINMYKYNIEKLEITNNKLKIQNDILNKENEFNKAKVDILEHYSNSNILIDKVKEYKLNKESIDAINSISNNFYNFFDRVQK